MKSQLTNRIPATTDDGPSGQIRGPGSFFAAMRAPFAAAALLPFLYFTGVGFIDMPAYPAIHMLMELFAISIATLIFALGWMSYFFSHNRTALFLSCAFLAVGILDAAHTLSIKEMPELFTPGSVPKGIYFWLTARFVEMASLFSISVFRRARLFGGSRPADRTALLGVTLALTFTLLWIGFLHVDALPATWREGTGLTPLKVALELSIAAMHLVAAAFIASTSFRAHAVFEPRSLFSANILLAVTGVSVSLYHDPNDLFLVAGHVFKAAAYIYVFRAVVTVGIRTPFRLKESAELAARAKETQLSTLIDSMPVMILALDSGQRVTSWNRECERVLGVLSHEVLGRPVAELPAPARGLFATAVPREVPGEPRRAPQGRPEDPAEIPDDSDGVRTIADSAGREHFIALTELTDQAPIPGWTRWMIAVDVTEKTQIERQLRHSQKLEAVGRLAAGVAHDFNNLLAVITAAAESLHGQLLLRGPGNPTGREHQNLTQILGAAERGSRFTRRLLSFSRTTRVAPVLLDLNAVLLETQPLLTKLLGGRITLEMDLGEKLPPVLADLGMLEQIVMNLAINARDAMSQLDAPGMLQVRTSLIHHDAAQSTVAGEIPAGGYVRLTVSDTGHGIAPDLLKRIFEPFFTTKKPEAGTGIGLSTVIANVRHAAGGLTVESTPGRGATFRIDFPARQQDPVAGSGTVPAPRPAENLEGLRILIIEDEESLRELVAGMLEALGASVVRAESAEEALRQMPSPAEGTTFDLVITDVSLPGMTGPEFARQLQQQGRLRSVLFISGFLDESQQKLVNTTERGIFLQKPFTQTQFREAVSRALAR